MNGFEEMGEEGGYDEWFDQQDRVSRFNLIMLLSTSQRVQIDARHILPSCGRPEGSRGLGAQFCATNSVHAAQPQYEQHGSSVNQTAELKWKLPLVASNSVCSRPGINLAISLWLVAERKAPSTRSQKPTIYLPSESCFLHQTLTKQNA